MSPRWIPVGLLTMAGAGGCGPAVQAPPPAPPGPAAVAAPSAPAAAPQAPTPPVAAKRPVVDEYQGVRVQDDYRWLENPADPETKAWTEGQTRFARGWLDGLASSAALRSQITKIKTAQSADYFYLTRRGHALFALELDPSKAQQPRLIRMGDDANVAAARVLVDPNALDAGGSIAIDYYVPSLDGKKVAVSLSRGGTEIGTLHVYDAETGKETGDVIPRVNGGTAGGSVAWSKDGSGLDYTRYPAPGERPDADLPFYQQVYYHKLGTDPKTDTYVVGKDYPKIAEIELERRDDGEVMLIQVANGDGGERAYYLEDAKGKISQVARFEDEVVGAAFGNDGGLYLLSHKGAPKGRILRVPANHPDLAKAKVIVPESDASIGDFIVTKTRLFVVGVVGGPSEVAIYDLHGKPSGKVPLPPVSSVRQIVGSEDDDNVFFRSQTFITPPAWYRYHDGASQKTSMAMASPASFDDAEVVREMCTSKDGTQVPVNIIRKKDGPMDGQRPALLTGYGGYGIVVSPGFHDDARVWLDHGGVFAVANLRGGGEFGEAWHKAGYLTHKQNVFDDMAACAQHLIDKGYTNPKKLAAVGGSNGGLLMGAMETQHPELFRAIVSFVGIYDMLRVESTPNGSFNVTEFGSVQDPEQFKALYAYSPYHHVTDGVAYPSMLLVTGENDPRVDSWQSKKMTARLQAASPATRVLLVSKPASGHGVGSSIQEDIDDSVAMYSFLLHELGVN